MSCFKENFDFVCVNLLNMKNIAIFASGSGTNAENIIRYFSGNKNIATPVVLCNKPDAGVLERASRLGVATEVFTAAQMRTPGFISGILDRYAVDYVVLAGFLLLVPAEVTEAYRGRIVNIHPALLPSYGGKGMYGDRVHEAVIAAGEKRSGITIHHVTENYDEGANIFQAFVDIMPDDTPASLAAKIHKLEYEHFPAVIEREIEQL